MSECPEHNDTHTTYFAIALITVMAALAVIKYSSDDVISTSSIDTTGSVIEVTPIPQHNVWVLYKGETHAITIPNTCHNNQRSVKKGDILPIHVTTTKRTRSGNTYKVRYNGATLYDTNCVSFNKVNTKTYLF